ncbi:hypothetical protein ACIBEF_29245 [Micromonospora sp. NPDC050795]|uniref:hypothetical protein n=1 Tax=Micromonospora sp. NPDC050795 TaxID=3364282 RepID=UPI00378B1A28
MANAAKKTNTTTTTDPVADAARVLADARELLVIREADAEQATEGELVVKSRLNQGDADVKADDIMRARFEVERTAGLVNAAKGAINAAERALSAAIAEHEPHLAERVAESIRTNGWGWGLHGVSVHLGKPTKDAPSPSVWAYQDKPATADKSGALSGSVNLVIVTPDGAHIEDARTMISGAQELARKGGGDVDAYAGPHGQGTSIRLTFRGLRAGIPVLPVGQIDPKDAPWSLLRQVIDEGPKDWRRTGSLGRREVMPTITGSVRDAELSSSEVDGRDLVRVIDGTIVMFAVNRDHFDRVAASMAGNWSPGVGAFVSVEVTGWTTREVHSPGRAYGIETTARVRLTMRARVAR